MDNAVHIKNGALAALAAVWAFVAQALGGWTTDLAVLLAMMTADYITGWLVAAVWKRSNKSETGSLDSKASFKGLVKKGVILLLVWLGVLLDTALGLSYVRTAVVLFFIGNEGLSLLENIGLMGVPFPAFLKNMLEAMKDQSNDGKTDGEA